MAVVTLMAKNQVRTRAILERLAEVLDLRIYGRKPTVGKVAESQVAATRGPHQHVHCTLRLSATTRSATQHHPIYRWLPRNDPASTRNVAPQPISMSSQWAPTQRTRSARLRTSRMRSSIVGRTIRHSDVPAGRGRFQTIQGQSAARFHAVEGDLVLEGVHRLPEALVAIDSELALRDQSLERLLDQFVAFLDVVEDLAAQAEEAAVDPELGVCASGRTR